MKTLSLLLMAVLLIGYQSLNSSTSSIMDVTDPYNYELEIKTDTILCVEDMYNSNIEDYQKKNQYVRETIIAFIRDFKVSKDTALLFTAQACLESFFGLSKTCRLTNNHFGITANTNWKGKKVLRSDNGNLRYFRSYISKKQSFQDRIDLDIDLKKYAEDKKYVNKISNYKIRLERLLYKRVTVKYYYNFIPLNN